jgi:RND family efflux transporter MFP subunit
LRPGATDTLPSSSREGSADDAGWQRFAGAASAEAFCAAWLALLCRELRVASAGAVLLESPDSNTFVPMAVWPERVGDLSRLGSIAERTLSGSQAVMQRAGASTQLGYPLQVLERTVGAIALEISVTDDAQVKDIARRLHWGAGWISELLQRRQLEQVAARTERVGTVLEAVATALRPGGLQQTLLDLSNYLARHLGCSRVAIGLTRQHNVRVAALSDAAWVEKGSAVAKRYAAAMEEALDRRERLDQSAPAQAELARETGAGAVVSLPLLVGAECIGVLTLERGAGGAFGAEDHAWLEAFGALLAPVIEQKRRAERGHWARLTDDGRLWLSRLFGPRHLVWKFGSALALLLVAVLALVEIDYRVTAKTVIEGEIQRVAAAPFEGFVAKSHVRAGDTVREGQVLVELDDRDLKVEQAKWSAEREQHDKKLREAMANRDMAAIQVIGAQLKQAQAQLALADEKLKRAQVRAPFDGIVVSGDLTQLIGSPVETGKKLFEVAPLASYRVILQVDEREIRHVEVGQSGRLVISGFAGDALDFRVSKVTPVASAQDGRNFFRVEAQLADAPPRLRPGMEGVGKVNVGEQRLWWILTHTFTDWLRLALWSWMP